MKAKELVGKNAIRTLPIHEMVENNGYLGFGMGLIQKPIYNFMGSPIKILKVTDSHIVYESETLLGEKKPRILDCRYCDDAWIDYDELMNLEVVQRGEPECMDT